MYFGCFEGYRWNTALFKGLQTALFGGLESVGGWKFLIRKTIEQAHKHGSPTVPFCAFHGPGFFSKWPRTIRVPWLLIGLLGHLEKVLQRSLQLNLFNNFKLTFLLEHGPLGQSGSRHPPRITSRTTGRQKLTPCSCTLNNFAFLNIHSKSGQMR